jgi:hypothetical protein
MTKVFCPQHFSGKYKLKVKAIGLWHWHTRRHFDSFIYRTADRLHYLGYHAPLPIQKKWRKVAQKFQQKYQKII